MMIIHSLFYRDTNMMIIVVININGKYIDGIVSPWVKKIYEVN